MSTKGHKDVRARKIGIVAIGRNEGARLEQCLASILSKSRRVVYADSASSDDSVEVACRLGVEVISLPENALLSAAAGRVAGFECLRSLHPEVDMVQFIDGDCLLDPEWLATAADFLWGRPQAAVVCGRRYEAQPKASIYNAICDAEWDTPVGQAQACGGDALYRVVPYEAAGGFRSDLLAGEEPELCSRMRARDWEIWRIDALMTEHDAHMLHFGQWWRRSRRGGYGYAQVWNVTRKTGDPLYSRQLASALAWTIGLPLALIICAIVVKQPIVMAMIPVTYVLQAGRIYRKNEDDHSRRLARAALTVFAKVPESIGALLYIFRADRRARGKRP